MIELKNINKIYKTKNGNIQALENINLSFPDKGLFILSGESGSGKTTLINLLSGVDKPTQGSIVINCNDLNNISFSEQEIMRNIDIGIISQEYNLFEHLSVYENIDIVFKLQGKSGDKKIDQMLEEYGIENIKKKTISTLSGGEKARVALIRAIIKNPKIILADEPTENLDKNNARYVWESLKKISRDHLVIVATHDFENSQIFADEIISIENGRLEKEYNFNDSINTESKQNNIFKCSLKFKDYLKIFYLPLKLQLAMILFFSLIMLFICTCDTISKVDTKKIHIDLLLSEQNYKIRLYKEKGDIPYTEQFNYEDLGKINAVIPLKYQNHSHESNLIVDGDNFFFDFENTSDITDYYKLYSKSEFANNLFSMQVPSFSYVGKYPTKSNEIMISNFFADYILRLGLKYTTNSNLDSINYSDLIGKKIDFGSFYFEVCGIYLVDTDIKNKSFISNNDIKLMLEYLYKFYVSDNFFEESAFPINGHNLNTINMEYNGKPFTFMETSMHGIDDIIISRELANEIMTEKGIKNIENLIDLDVTINFNDIYHLYGITSFAKKFKIIGISNVNILNKDVLVNLNISHEFIRYLDYEDLPNDIIGKVLNLNDNKIKVYTKYSEDIGDIDTILNNTNGTLTLLKFLAIIISFTVSFIVFDFIYKKQKGNIKILLLLGLESRDILKVTNLINDILTAGSILLLMFIYNALLNIGNLIVSKIFNYSINLLSFNYQSITVAVIPVLIVLIIYEAIKYYQLRYQCIID